MSWFRVIIWLENSVKRLTRPWSILTWDNEIHLKLKLTIKSPFMYLTIMYQLQWLFRTVWHKIMICEGGNGKEVVMVCFIILFQYSPAQKATSGQAVLQLSFKPELHHTSYIIVLLICLLSHLKHLLHQNLKLYILSMSCIFLQDRKQFLLYAMINI